MSTSPQVDGAAFAQVVDEMTSSVTSVREVIRSLIDKHQSDPESMNHKDGISLLSLKNHVLLQYLHSMVLLSAQRVLGHSLKDRNPPNASFASTSRDARGADAGDLVDSLVESRAILEKSKALEARMRYQIDKLMRVAQEAPNSTTNDVMNDPLAFRPNPQNLMDQDNADVSDDDKNNHEPTDRSGIYRPPKVAPMPYTESSSRKKDSKRREGPIPSALLSLSHLGPSDPHVESSTGLGSMPSRTSGRARELEEMREFEESNMTRLVMKKKDHLRRLRDEEDVALGGVGGSGRKGGRVNGLETEFADVLRGIGRSKRSAHGDGYDELRARGKKDSVLSRSRVRKHVSDPREGAGAEGRPRKKSRFEQEVKSTKRKTKNRR